MFFGDALARGFHLSDAAHDQRALRHSFVADLGIRFYAAAPLRNHEGFNLGTVWVLDQKPRELAPSEAEMLRVLAALAMNQMELRLYAERSPGWNALNERSASNCVRRTRGCPKRGTIP